MPFRLLPALCHPLALYADPDIWSNRMPPSSGLKDNGFKLTLQKLRWGNDPIKWMDCKKCGQ